MTMSLQIISVLPAHEEAASYQKDSHTNGSISNLLSAIPPAPPLPPGGLFTQKVWRKSQDLDSGCGSLGDNAFFGDLPGCNISDDEFTENFAASSQASSPRSSSPHGLSIITIPEPPPPPPIQFWLPRFNVVGLEEIQQRRLEPDFDVDLQRLRRYDSDLSSLDESIIQRGRLGEEATENGVAGTCIICYDDGTAFTRLPCCREIVCPSCLTQAIQTRLSDGLIEFPCPNPECSDPIGRTEVLRHLTREEKDRFERLRVNAESDGKRKTCPHCSHITEHTLPVRKMRKFREEEVKIQCENCRIEWCYKCHAPWHQDLTCKAFTKGNRQFQKWTKDRPNGVANCQKCPTCRVYIQRSTGCDHMTCNRCSSEFCYKCGERFVEIPCFGDHYGQMSVFGCKYNYLANQPVKRKMLRGGYFGAKMAMLTGYPILFIGGVAVLVVVGAVAVPIYVSYRLYKFKKNTNRLRRRQRRVH